MAPLIAEIAAALDGRWAYEIIYVDDGSTDATPQRLARLMKRARDNLRQIRHASILRAIGGGAQRRARRARRHRGDARRRRPEQSGVPAGPDRGDRTGRRPRRPRRRPAGRPQGHRLQEVAVAHRQRRAQRDPARRHPRHRLRPEGVPPRRVPVAALFRRAASLPAGAGAPRGFRHRLCRRRRPAAPVRRVQLRLLRPAVDRDHGSRRRVVADPPQEADACRDRGDS